MFLLWLPSCDSYHIVSWPVSINKCRSLTSVKLTDNSNGSFSAPLCIVHSLYCIIYKNIQIFFCKTFHVVQWHVIKDPYTVSIISPPILPNTFPSTAFQRSVAATLNKSHATRRSLTTTTDFHDKLPWLPQKVERTKHTQKRWWVGVNGTKDGGRGDEKNKVYCNRPEQCTFVTAREGAPPAGSSPRISGRTYT